MGYTHYWSFKKPNRGQSKRTELLYQKALIECVLIAKRYQEQATGLDRLSGYSVFTKLGDYGGFKINGKGTNSHEDFTLREHYIQNRDHYTFCKTAMKPYDTVVVACLALLKHRLGDLITVSSDGNSADWTRGLEFVNNTLNLKIKNPIVEIVKERCTKCNHEL